ncbi:PTS lactose/cellobiose transporter subunit IIA [Lacrimispora sp.]|uniref:PTS lactose/cellobiose transporter subunit IIA n=1 Tax=Lacrimispora sp. TaxID=2719234 RepID=UPI00289EC37C|nr:PTS lactose/cellobiose transporter subunit IIA [Lacrimispora sp.]
MQDMELICFQLITAAGGAKSSYIEAIQLAKEEKYEEAEGRIAQGDEMMKNGHFPHVELIQKEAAGETVTMGLILAHAEDQMMSAEVFKVVAEEMISLYKRLGGR